jgi:DNA-binding GntR family transcriptional regulator
MVFGEIATISLRDKVVAALKDAFFSGQLKPGDLIVERQLGRQMNVGTPTVREALIILEQQGFLRRVANTATYVTRFSPEEVRQLYVLRIELELSAFRWAKSRVTEADLEDLCRMVDRLVEAGETGNARDFLERDMEFHRRCWMLSGNQFLAATLERLMSPLFVFVVLASGVKLTAAMAREHYALVNALRRLEEPEFSTVVRATVSGFAMRWIASMSAGDANCRQD